MAVITAQERRRKMLRNDKGPTVKRTVPRTVLSFLAHLSIGTIGILILSDFLVSSLFSIIHIWDPLADLRHVHWILAEVPGFPVQAVVGLLLGFVLAKWMRRSIMVWVWVLPLVFLCLAALFLHENFHSILNHYFGQGCRPTDRCFDQLALTLPLITTIAYALGAKLCELRDGRVARVPGMKSEHPH